MMNMRRMLAAVLALCMVLALAPVAPARAAEVQQLEFEKLDKSGLGVALSQNGLLEEIAPAVKLDANEMVQVIILMDGKSVIQENPTAQLNATSQNKMDALKQQQNAVLNKIEKDVLKAELDVAYHYTWLINGVATTVPYGAIAKIKAMDGVANVILQRVYTVCETTDAVATPNTVTDGVMIGRESTWANGYTGEGMKIAIIDTGLDTDHQNFAALGAEKLTDTSANADTVAAVLENLNASDRYSGLTLEDVYYSTKVVFGFNYCDNILDITHADGISDHGTHVAGIAAANKVEGSEVVGVAPDAQLYIMKVFGLNGGAYTRDILAALEDALMLGADVINMSLGSPAGFTSGEYADNGRFLDEVYASIAETGTVLSVSAGNNYTSALDNFWGTDLNPTAYPDNGVVGSPGTYANTMTVASVENWKIQRNYIDAGGYHMTYYDSSAYDLPELMSLTGEYEFVVVPGVGDVSDYEGLDVAGKIALVQRGALSFMDKHKNAEAAGAIATLVWNNTTGEFGMDMTGTTCKTPAAAITMADGAYLVANPTVKLTFPEGTEGFPTDLAYTMSDFSSQGPAPDLTLAPDITAPGGNIYSTINNGEYGLMSGTSMAAPNIAGMAALVMQYVRETFPEGTDYRMMTQNLLMSTSVPLSYDETVAYSPRSQGSGLANAYNAVTTGAYLSVKGADNAKIDLGDDANRTGTYDFSFDVTNFSDADAYYRVATTAQTEGAVGYAGTYFMSGTPVVLDAATTAGSSGMMLTHDLDNDGDTDTRDAYLVWRASVKGQEVAGWEAESFRYDVNADEAVAAADVQAYLDALVGKTSAAVLEDQVLKVEAGKSVSVSVNVALADSDKAYLDAVYVNGGYVEGFTTLTAVHSGGVDLSLPYLGFYGSWAESPVLDEGSYWDYLNADNTSAICNQYPHLLFSEFQGDEYGIYPGMNAYVDEKFDMAHISLSPNGDGYLDTITDLYLSLMRNASSLTITYTDMDTEEVYFDVTIDNVHKTVYYASYGQIVPFAYDLFIAEPQLWADWDQLENNARVLLRCEVVGVAEGDEPEVWEVPITIDLEAPELLSADLEQTEDGKTLLNLSFRDNLSAAVAMVIDGAGVKALALEGVEDVETDENGYQNYTKTFDITGLTGKVAIILGDYAVNESYYGINLGGEGTPYGDLVAYQYNYNTGVYGWVSFDADVNKDETTIFTNFEMDFVAAEYVNGFVYAQTEDGKLYGFKYTDMLNNTMTLDQVFVAQLENVYQDFAYNYSDGKLYGLLTTEEMWYGEPSVQSEIFSINIKGEYYDEDMWSTVAPFQEDWVQSRGGLFGLCLAIDDAGAIYILGQYHENLYDDDWNYTGTDISNAQLWKAEMEEDWGWVSLGAFQLVGDTGMSMDYLQSMIWDHNTEKLYWARFDGGASFTEQELIEINPAEVTEDEEGNLMVSAVKIGQLSGETCGLFAPLSDEAAATHTNVPEMDETVVGTPTLRESVVNMSLGSTKTLAYDIAPWYTSVRNVVWSSSDESVATVDQKGNVTAVSAGSATITVAAAADESLFDTCAVEVSALSLKFEGIVSTMGSGIGAVYNPTIYDFTMVEGISKLNRHNAITASEDLNYGLSLATSEYARGSIWACEYGNTGMVYEIDATTGAVKNVFQPINGDMMFGMHYSEKLDTFTNIMNFYLYVDIPMNEEMYDEMMGSYDEEQNNFMWHRINMLEYLQAAGGSFVTGETGQGASSEIVFTAITGIDGGIRDAWGETYYNDTYRDYLGNWAMGGTCSYQPDQTLILLDNVGRLWFINQVNGVTVESDEWGNVFLMTADGGMLDASRPGVIMGNYTAEDGTISVFHITKIQETPLTDMFRDGTMPRITYHFSDIEFAGYTAEGDPMIAMSLYDYWNNGLTNKLYLYIPGHETDEMDYETWEPIVTPDRLFALGDTGEYGIIASIHSAVVTGGVDAEEPEVEIFAVKKLAAGLFKAK